MNHRGWHARALQVARANRETISYGFSLAVSALFLVRLDMEHRDTRARVLIFLGWLLACAIVLWRVVSDRTRR